MQNRRDFLKTLGLSTVCVCGSIMTLDGCSMVRGVSAVEVIPASAIRQEGQQVRVDLSKAESLRKIGGAGKLTIIAEDGSQTHKLIVVRPSENEFRVFGDHCTHGGRELNYRHSESKLECSSFGHSSFNLKGQVTGGPAKAPLSMFAVRTENEILVIHLP